MRAAMEADLDFAFSDRDVGRDVDEITEDLASLSVGIAAHGFGEDAIEPTGDDERTMSKSILSPTAEDSASM